ncbi:hypothetical protein [Clostridium sp. DJ247]|uniref:hypothetical protein n=1 Tax=Clostridium sp. DJ247 TaxID=2726188 RepID=UPI001627E5F9|nr:hypothetical protein [Clostridium sp. DJ247]MBC2580175.1 hypothetical protein [Clostridium sp. DJ247]
MKKFLKWFLCLIIFIVPCVYVVLYNWSSSESSKNFSTVKPEEHISKFFISIRSGDFNTAALYLDKSKEVYNNDLKFSSETEEKLLREVFARTDYKILSCSYRNNKGEAFIEVNSPDLFAIYGEMTSTFLQPLIDKYINGNDKEKVEAKNKAKELGMKYVMDRFNSNNCPRTTNKVKIKLLQQNGNWTISMNRELIYALTGRMPQLLEKTNSKS